MFQRAAGIALLFRHEEAHRARTSLEIDNCGAVRPSHESKPEVLIWEIQLLFIYPVIQDFFSITAGAGTGRGEAGGCVCAGPFIS